MNNLSEDNQPFGIQSGYSSPTASVVTTGLTILSVRAGTIGGTSTADIEVEKLCKYDPDLPSGTMVSIYSILLSGLDQIDSSEMGLRHLTVDDNNTTRHGHIGASGGNSAAMSQVRRLTTMSGTTKTRALLFFTGSAEETGDFSHAAVNASWRQTDDFSGASTSIGAVLPATDWGLENQTAIPEIEIKVDSVSVTAQTKKLKAKWSPELGQDLNAYHNLDAEVELTSILSEQIALELDREILGDLIGGAKAATYYWSRSPGLFVNKSTGAELGAASAAPDFTGTVSEWYETLIETINDVSAQIHRKTLRGGANFVVCSPEAANILEFTSGFRANVSHADEKGSIGAVNVGSLSKKFDVMVDPYFPRNVILVGRKGNSFLESGYVYAPYVPLQVTPTIFGIDDFVPRKGVMTRYAKKMVRPDMYGLVVVRGLLGEEGAS
jgi:hypothetical protein